MKSKRKGADARSYAANYQHRHRAEGLCRLCPNVAGINPRTLKSYHHCATCRKTVAARQKIVMQERRAEG